MHCSARPSLCSSAPSPSRSRSGSHGPDPSEHLLQDAWHPAGRFFPGLLLEAFVAGGTPEVSATRAFLTVAVYVTAAAALAGMVFTRRDMTA